MDFPKTSQNPRQYWSQRAELNRRPTDYESVALPLSYAGITIGGNLDGLL
jgi:hypothetical protein